MPTSETEKTDPVSHALVPTEHSKSISLVERILPPELQNLDAMMDQEKERLIAELSGQLSLDLLVNKRTPDFTAVILNILYENRDAFDRAFNHHTEMSRKDFVQAALVWIFSTANALHNFPVTEFSKDQRVEFNHILLIALTGGQLKKIEYKDYESSSTCYQNGTAYINPRGENQILASIHNFLLSFRTFFPDLPGRIQSLDWTKMLQEHAARTTKNYRLHKAEPFYLRRFQSASGRLVAALDWEQELAFEEHPHVIDWSAYPTLNKHLAIISVQESSRQKVSAALECRPYDEKKQCKSVAKYSNENIIIKALTVLIDIFAKFEDMDLSVGDSGRLACKEAKKQNPHQAAKIVYQALKELEDITNMARDLMKTTAISSQEETALELTAISRVLWRIMPAILAQAEQEVKYGNINPEALHGLANFVRNLRKAPFMAQETRARIQVAITEGIQRAEADEEVDNL
jgi:hypothetical protein